MADEPWNPKRKPPSEEAKREVRAAFEKLTPEQQQELKAELDRHVPQERAAEVQRFLRWVRWKHLLKVMDALRPDWRERLRKKDEK